MINDKYLYYIIIISFLSLSPSCDFTDTNVNPSNLSIVDLDTVLPSVLAQAAYNQMGSNAILVGIVNAQFYGWDGCGGGTYVDRIQPLIDSYWTSGVYGGSLTNSQYIIEKAEQLDAPYYAGIAKVIMALDYGRTTALLGDIPFSEALQAAAILQPRYDRQEDVYEGIQLLLDEAITLLSGNGGGLQPEEDDLIFGGDSQRWIKTAWALKARFLVHTSKRYPENWIEILNIIQENVLQIEEEQPFFKWGSTSNEANPLYKIVVERPSTIIIEETFAAKMKDLVDPRLKHYGKYDGHYYALETDGRWTKRAAKIPLISLQELLFYRAEGLLRIGADKTTIKASLAQAIRASMKLVEVEEAAAIEEYIEKRISIDELTEEQILERIIEESYVANYGLAFLQAWTSWRRTNYPDLSYIYHFKTHLNPSGVQPQRFIYPDSENFFNSKNLNAAIEAQGGALQDNALWAFK